MKGMKKNKKLLNIYRYQYNFYSR